MHRLLQLSVIPQSRPSFPGDGIIRNFDLQSISAAHTGTQSSKLGQTWQWVEIKLLPTLPVHRQVNVFPVNAVDSGGQKFGHCAPETGTIRGHHEP